MHEYSQSLVCPCRHYPSYFFEELSSKSPRSLGGWSFRTLELEAGCVKVQSSELELPACEVWKLLSVYLSLELLGMGLDS